MTISDRAQEQKTRSAAIDIAPEEFRELGHRLIDQISDFLHRMPEGKVTPGDEPDALKEVLGAGKELPANGTQPSVLLDRAAQLLFNHSLFNGHPRFWGYITSSPAPIGMLGDLLATAVNSNVGSWKLAPMATEIESQTVRWIADLIGYPVDCGGLLVSGGNMANFVGFLAARKAKADWDIREQGIGAKDAKRFVVYASKETHTWMQKAADLFGIGTQSIRWIATDTTQRMDLRALVSQIENDRSSGLTPFIIVGTAGSVSTGAVDPLFEIAKISKQYNLWFHVDGAYGGFAARVKGAPADLAGLAEADSVAIDPHKWLYAPLEAGCALVRNPEHLTETFSYHPPYYRFDQSVTNYVDYGMQNSRAFKALKVWLALQQVGREGCLAMIGEDIRLSKMLYDRLKEVPELQAFTQGLSITTFRFVPSDLLPTCTTPVVSDYLNKLNEEIMLSLEKSGEAFVSPAVIDGNFLLRACIVNFRTSERDITMFPVLIRQIGVVTDQRLRVSSGLRG
jgi:aromatic-L-amino-acid decarboxylase